MSSLSPSAKTDATKQPMKSITRSKGGLAERVVPVDQIKVPDCWHIAMRIGETDPVSRDVILETWRLCHDLLRSIQEGHQ